MTRVWELDLPCHQQMVLLAMADHASDDGTGCYPGVEYLAWKVNRSPRTVQYILRQLEDPDGCGEHICPKHLIAPTRYRRGGRGRATEYILVLDHGRPKPAMAPEDPAQTDLFGPTERVQPSAERVQPTAEKGATHFTPTVSEPSEPKPTSATRSVANSGRFPEEAKRLAHLLQDELRGRGRTSFARDWYLTSAAAAGAMLRSGVPPPKLEDGIRWALRDRFWSTRLAHMRDMQTALGQYELARASPARASPVDRATEIWEQAQAMREVEAREEV